VYSFPIKFAAKTCKHFPPHLNNVSALPCKKPDVLIAHMIPLSC